MFVLDIVVLNYLNYQYDYENDLLMLVLQELRLNNVVHVMMMVLLLMILMINVLLVKEFFH
jgi:hypothetical protein